MPIYWREYKLCDMSGRNGMADFKTFSSGQEFLVTGLPADVRGRLGAYGFSGGVVRIGSEDAARKYAAVLLGVQPRELEVIRPGSNVFRVHGPRRAVEAYERANPPKESGAEASYDPASVLGSPLPETDRDVWQ